MTTVTFTPIVIQGLKKFLFPQILDANSIDPSSSLRPPEALIPSTMASSASEPTLEDLKPSEKKAMAELRLLIEEVIATKHLTSPSQSQKKKIRIVNSCPSPSHDPILDEDFTDISLWGVPLTPSKRDGGTNIILLKFLRAADFKPVEALEMIRKTLKWRTEFGADLLTKEELEVPDFEGAMYLSGFSREGHLVGYNRFGVFKERVLHNKIFGSEEMRETFLRSRVQFMERGIKELSFKPGAVSWMIQVIDLQDSSAASTKDLRSTMKKLFSIFEKYYPEIIERHIFINVPFRYYACHALFSRNISQRTKNKLIFARPSKVTETLLKFISPENIPIQYGGLHREDDDEFSEKNGVSELSLKGGDNATIEIPITEPGVTVVWDIAVAGWEVHLREEFIPDDECSYKVLIQKGKKLEETTRNSFYINEPGKVVLTVTNRTYKKKKVLYRWKSKPTVPLYNLLIHPVA